MGEYFTTGVNGNFMSVHDIDHIAEELRTLFRDISNRNEFLEVQNKKLKSDAYKDEELAMLQDQVAQMRRDAYRSFPITEEEDKAITAWQEQHEAKQHNATTSSQRRKLQGVSGGRYTYVFVPTAIGTSGTCRCGGCYTKAKHFYDTHLAELGDNPTYKQKDDLWKRACKEYDPEIEFQSL
jgi:hypothetical protein